MALALALLASIRIPLVVRPFVLLVLGIPAKDSRKVWLLAGGFVSIATAVFLSLVIAVSTHGRPFYTTLCAHSLVVSCESAISQESCDRTYRNNSRDSCRSYPFGPSDITLYWSNSTREPHRRWSSLEEVIG